MSKLSESIDQSRTLIIVIIHALSRSIPEYLELSVYVRGGMLLGNANISSVERQKNLTVCAK